jgi:soluble lytic murein transglycosylase
MNRLIIPNIVMATIIFSSCILPANQFSSTDLPNTSGTLSSPVTSPTPLPTNTLIPAPTLTLSPTPIPSERIQKGDIALSNGDWEKAVQEFQVALDLSDQSEIHADALLGLARAWLIGRNYYQATTVLEKIIQDFGTSPYAIEATFFLGQAYAAQERYSEAAEAYLNYLIQRPGVIDAYVLDLRGDVLFAAGNYSEAANDFQGALITPSQMDREYLQLKTARSFAISGDSTKALTLYDDIYYRTNNDYTKALIDLRKGQIYEGLGQIEQAQTVYLDAVNNYPKAYDSYTALIALVEAGVVVDELQRGVVDYYAEQYGVALAAFDRYLQTSPNDPAIAQYYYGLTQRALGGYEAAIKRWDIVIQNYPEHSLWDEAWEQKASTQWALMSQYKEAVKTLLDFVNNNPAHERAGEFLFDAALIAELGGDLTQATELFERVINLYPGYEKAIRSLFLAGITQYRLGNHQQALLILFRFQGLVTALEDRAMAQFWVAKIQNAMGERDTARKSWETAAGIDPTGYYSERARDILNDREPFKSPQVFDVTYDILAERAQAESWIRSTFSLPPETDLKGLLINDPALQRGAELWKLGLYDEARAEFEQTRLSLAADPVQSYKLANYLLELGAFRPAIMAVRQILDLAGMNDASTLGAPAYFNHVRFGAYYSDLIEPLAEEYNFHPLFLYSLIRQESVFEGFVHSTEGAIGLMQIMPATGADIVNNLGWPGNFAVEDLGRPLVNLRLGVDYLDTQRNAFDGDLYAALAAYNAGPGAAAGWKELAIEDSDLFLEIIRYEETRKYIRGVYELFTIYRLIYDRVP